MFGENGRKPCAVVKKVTDRETVRCGKPAQVFLVLNTPELLALCLACARELVKEIVDSVPGGKLDARVILAARGRK